MFASILFAYSSIAQKNEEGIDDPSMISKRMDSWRETALHRPHPLIPEVLLGAFFPVCAGVTKELSVITMEN